MPDYSDLFDPPAPVAEISVTDPATRKTIGNISMLLDTGADVTLLPRSVFEQLQPVGTSLIRLQAFDGSILERPVYDLTVTFLKGSFRDDFAITDAEIGVIGRNVLNHFRLVLDGPRQIWRAE